MRYVWLFLAVASGVGIAQAEKIEDAQEKQACEKGGGTYIPGNTCAPHKRAGRFTTKECVLVLPKCVKTNESPKAPGRPTVQQIDESAIDMISED